MFKILVWCLIRDLLYIDGDLICQIIYWIRGHEAWKTRDAAFINSFTEWDFPLQTRYNWTHWNVSISSDNRHFVSIERTQHVQRKMDVSLATESFGHCIDKSIRQKLGIIWYILGFNDIYANCSVFCKIYPAQKVGINSCIALRWNNVEQIFHQPAQKPNKTWCKSNFYLYIYIYIPSHTSGNAKLG